MTEEELRVVFAGAAGDHIHPGQLSPEAMAWLGQLLQLAAARGADRIDTQAEARRRADEFFGELLGRARPSSVPPPGDGAPAPGAISAEALRSAYGEIAGFTWPFGERPDS